MHKFTLRKFVPLTDILELNYQYCFTLRIFILIFILSLREKCSDHYQVFLLFCCVREGRHGKYI